MTTCSVVKSLGKVPTGLQIERVKSTLTDSKNEMFQPIIISTNFTFAGPVDNRQIQIERVKSTHTNLRSDIFTTLFECLHKPLGEGTKNPGYLGNGGSQQ